MDQDELADRIAQAGDEEWTTLDLSWEGNLTSWTELFSEKGETRLTALPPEIGQLTNLKELDLWDNRLTSLPPEIGNLTSLMSLHLWGNQLTSLPPEIGNLTSLIRLDLWDNQFTALPLEMQKLVDKGVVNFRSIFTL